MSERPEASARQARLELQWVNHLLDTDPLNPILCEKKAYLFEQAMTEALPRLQRLERTLLWYFQALRSDPLNWSAHYNCARILRELNRHEDAMLYARRAAKLNPQNHLIYKLLVMTLVRLGRNQEAADAYEDAVARGCPPGPEILGIRGDGKPLEAEDLKKLKDVGGVVEDSGDATHKLLHGELPFVFEAADPELFTLQFVIEELVEIDLDKTAEEVCIRFELKNGPNSLTRSFLNRLRVFYTLPLVPENLTISAAYPLMEVVDSQPSFYYRGIVRTIFSERGVGKYITPDDVDDFNKQTRWLMEQIGDFQISLNDPSLFAKPIPPDVDLVWRMAKLNFLVARKLNIPFLIAHSAATLAEFYARLGQAELPLTLYRIVAVNAEKAGQWDYFLTAHRNCAQYFTDQNEPGKAVIHLEKALSREKEATPHNRFQLHMDLGRCSLLLFDTKSAGQYFNQALAIPDITEKEREEARLTLIGFENLDQGVQVGLPPVLVDGLRLQSFDFKTPEMYYSFVYTSRHEFYDSLLQLVDTFCKTRLSLAGRKRGHAYLAGYAELVDTLVRLAIELKLPWNALAHLESQKNITLRNRLHYLMREKPADISDQLWDEFENLVASYRALVESSDDPSAPFEQATLMSPAEVAERIEARLWECNQISPVAARQIRLKLAMGQVPDKICCADPDHTRILEFYPGLCFVIRPDALQSLQVVELPEADNLACERLVGDFSKIITEWMSSPGQTPDRHLYDFLEHLDRVIYAPLAQIFAEGDIKNLLIIPSRAMHILPLNLLGRSLDPHGSLAERYAVSFAPSLSILDGLGEPISGKISKAVFVSNTLPSCPPEVCQNPAHDCYALDQSAAECREISAMFERQGISINHLSGEDAVLSKVCAEISHADVVHFAVHGLFDPQTPENSGVVLPLPHQRIDSDTPYLLHKGYIAPDRDPACVGQMLSLNYLWKNVTMFRCRLLNLSSCWTGMVDWSDRSDEFYGLANGFLYAGVQKILNCLWPVHDAASRQFNLLFYDALLKDDSHTAETLRRTVMKLRDYSIDGNKPFESPLFWANFRLVGFDKKRDPGVRLKY